MKKNESEYLDKPKRVWMQWSIKILMQRSLSMIFQPKLPWKIRVLSFKTSWRKSKMWVRKKMTFDIEFVHLFLHLWNSSFNQDFDAKSKNNFPIGCSLPKIPISVWVCHGVSGNWTCREMWAWVSSSIQINRHFWIWVSFILLKDQGYWISNWIPIENKKMMETFIDKITPRVMKKDEVKHGDKRIITKVLDQVEYYYFYAIIKITDFSIKSSSTNVRNPIETFMTKSNLYLRGSTIFDINISQKYWYICWFSDYHDFDPEIEISESPNKSCCRICEIRSMSS